MPAFLNPAEAEFWVGVGLLIFLAIVIFVAKAPAKLVGSLDERRNKIQFDLDEAARIRAEAEAMLADIRARREEAERQATEMLAAAEADAKRLQAESKIKLEEQVKRRADLAERKIATAEAQATADVKAAAADLAADAAERVLAARLAAGKADPQVDAAIAQLADRLQ
jgi:F-type H+-transporting ATPase subunit b